MSRPTDVMLLVNGKRELLAEMISRLGLIRLLSRAETWQGLVVFNYHRIGVPSDSPYDWELWSASQDEFDAQVAWLKRTCDIVTDVDLPGVLGSRCGRAAMITFDDGYRDNYELAFPVLRSHGVPATFFLATGFLDSCRVAWWDEIAWMVRMSKAIGVEANIWTIDPIRFDEPHRKQAIRRLLATYKRLEPHETEPFLDFLAECTRSGRCPAKCAEQAWMTWDMIREMHAAGMSIGGHTVNHPVLSTLPRERQQLEVSGCKRRIEEETGVVPTTFSYPVGGPNAFNSTTWTCLREAGFQYGFSYYGGYGTRETNPLDLPRVAVERSLTPSQFRATLALPQLFA